MKLAQRPSRVLIAVVGVLVALGTGAGVRLQLTSADAQAAITPPAPATSALVEDAAVLATSDRTADIAPGASTVTGPMFIKFDGVDGEATDKDHKGWSDMTAFSQAISRSGPGAAGSSRARGSAELQPISVEKPLDKASPKLAEAILKGQVFTGAEIHLTAAYTDAGRVVYYKYELKNVQITSYQVDGSANSYPADHMLLSYEEIKVTYTVYDSQGKKLGDVGYDWIVGQ